MPVHQPVRSERPVNMETLERMHRENQQATRQPVTPAEVDNHIDYLRREPSQRNPKPGDAL